MDGKHKRCYVLEDRGKGGVKMSQYHAKSLVVPSAMKAVVKKHPKSRIEVSP